MASSPGLTPSLQSSGDTARPVGQILTSLPVVNSELTHHCSFTQDLSLGLKGRRLLGTVARARPGLSAPRS